MTTTCMIVDDEPNAVKLLQDHIGKIPSLQLAASCYDAAEAMQFLKTNAVDLVFLDINMPHLTGLEMAALMPKNQRIVFTTAYSEHALDSFDYFVVDYLLKPITFRRFVQAVDKLHTTLVPGTGEPEAGPDFAFVKSGRHWHKVPYDSILYVEGLKEYIALHTPTGRLLVYKRMKEMAETLPPQFTRIHNSYIVNMAQVTRFDNTGISIGDTILPVSDSYRETFLRKIRGRLL